MCHCPGTWWVTDGRKSWSLLGSAATSIWGRSEYVRRIAYSCAEAELVGIFRTAVNPSLGGCGKNIALRSPCCAQARGDQSLVTRSAHAPSPVFHAPENTHPSGLLSNFPPLIAQASRS